MGDFKTTPQEPVASRWVGLFGSTILLPGALHWTCGTSNWMLDYIVASPLASGQHWKCHGDLML
eukprot:9828883-Prorocentrum_lima.AAC.1